MTIKPHVVTWLASMGYRVRGCDAVDLLAMCAREALMWQLPPATLERMIREGSLQPVEDRPPSRPVRVEVPARPLYKQAA